MIQAQKCTGIYMLNDRYYYTIIIPIIIRIGLHHSLSKQPLTYL